MTPKTKQITITLYEDTADRIENRIDKKGGQSRSECINTDLCFLWDSLQVGLNEARRVLTRNEAKLIIDCLNGAYLGLGSPISSYLGLFVNGGFLHEITDGIELNKLDEKWKVDSEHIIKTIAKLSPLAIISLLDFASCFWKKPDTEIDNFVSGFKD